jgi:hypothetical protein
MLATFTSGIWTRLITRMEVLVVATSMGNIGARVIVGAVGVRVFEDATTKALSSVQDLGHLISMFVATLPVVIKSLVKFAPSTSKLHNIRSGVSFFPNSRQFHLLPNCTIPRAVCPSSPTLPIMIESLVKFALSSDFALPLNPKNFPPLLLQDGSACPIPGCLCCVSLFFDNSGSRVALFVHLSRRARYVAWVVESDLGVRMRSHMSFPNCSAICFPYYSDMHLGRVVTADCQAQVR